MVYASEVENAIYLWWDKRLDFVDGCYYRIILDGDTVVYTKNILFDFCNIDTSKKHKFVVDMLDNSGKVVGMAEIYESTNLFSKKTALDITKPPYNAKGDGVTDCTNAVKRAFLDCDKNKLVYFPLGTYYCKEISFNGNVKVVFDSCARVVDEKVTGLC